MNGTEITTLAADLLADFNLALHVANTILKDYDRAHESVQEAIYRALVHASAFDPNKPARPWFLRIVRNVCLDELKRVTRFVDMPEVVDHASPVDALLRTERTQRIRAAVHTLPESYRAVVHLRYDKGYNYRDIATTLCIPIGTTKTFLHRAHKALREELTQTGAA